MEGQNLKKANLQEACLREAILQEVHFEGANLQGANLEGAILRGSYLWQTNLKEASLINADLQDVQGLQSWQLSGADVSGAKLPEAIANFEGLANVREASKGARKLYVSMLIACAYSVLTISVIGAQNTNDGGGDYLLPIVSVPMPRLEFFLYSGVALFFVFAFFHLRMQRLWEEIAELPAVFPDGRPLDRRIHPWPVTSIVRNHVRKLRERPAPPFSELRSFVVGFLTWASVPSALAFIAFSSIQNPGWCIFFCVLCGFAILVALSCYTTARRTLRGEE